MKQIIKPLIIFVFVALYLLTSTLSMINSLDFFKLSHNITMSWFLAIAFEIGAAASLCSLVILDKMNKLIVWLLFITLTLFQIMSNVYNVYINLHDFQGWIELFGLVDEEIIYQKRILSIISGALLPLIALGFIKALMNYIKPDEKKNNDTLLQTTEINTPSETITPDVEVSTTEGKDVATESPITTTPIEEYVTEEPIEPNEDFKAFMEHKKRQVEDMREPNLELLDIFYNQGVIQKGDELLTYNELLSKIDRTRFTQKEINFFLTLCNYLEIFRLSGIQRIALMSYDEAKKTLSDYLTIGDES